MASFIDRGKRVRASFCRGRQHRICKQKKSSRYRHKKCTILIIRGKKGGRPESKEQSWFFSKRAQEGQEMSQLTEDEAREERVPFFPLNMRGKYPPKPRKKGGFSNTGERKFMGMRRRAPTCSGKNTTPRVWEGGGMKKVSSMSPSKGGKVMPETLPRRAKRV